MVFVAISSQVAENETKKFGIRPVVIPNWAGDDFYSKSWKPRHGSGIRVVSVGNCGEPKNHEALIDAVSILSGFGVSYAHVGDESGAVSDERALAKSRGVQELVDFLGAKAPLPHLLDADVFVMPSKREGFGISALEAMALGVPTVLADSPGLREFADVPGIWWSSPESQSLARVLTDVAATPIEGRVARALATMRHVREHYSPESGRVAYIGLYRRMGM